MTLSADDRRRDMGLARELIIQAVGGHALDSVECDTDEPPFNQILPTTWKVLEDRVLIRRTPGWGRRCELTGDGWYVCMKALGKFNEPEFHGMMQTLAAALQKQIKGRRDEALVYAESLANAAGLPLDFVFNAIESRLLDHEFNIEGAYWDEHGRTGMWIRVPIDFGHPPDC